MGANPHANGGILTVALDIPSFTELRGEARAARQRQGRIDATLRQDDARYLHAQRQAAELPPVLSRRDQLQSPRRRVRGREPMPGEPRRELRRSRLARRPRDGSAERALPSGLARRLHAHRASRSLRVLRGVRDDRRFDGDAAREVAADLPDRVAVAASGAVARTTCSLRPAGATITTASAIRAPASSTRC